MEMGLVDKKDDEFSISEKNLHISKNSPYARSLYMSWRTKVMNQLQQDISSGEHYSGAHTMDHTTFQNLQTNFTEFLVESRKNIENAPSEELVYLGVDFFAL